METQAEKLRIKAVKLLREQSFYLQVAVELGKVKNNYTGDQETLYSYKVTLQKLQNTSAKIIAVLEKPTKQSFYDFKTDLSIQQDSPNLVMYGLARLWLATLATDTGWGTLFTIACAKTVYTYKTAALVKESSQHLESLFPPKKTFDSYPIPPVLNFQQSL